MPKRLDLKRRFSILIPLFFALSTLFALLQNCAPPFAPNQFGSRQEQEAFAALASNQQLADANVILSSMSEPAASQLTGCPAAEAKRGTGAVVTAELQACLSALKPGEMLELPPGVYTIDRMLKPTVVNTGIRTRGKLFSSPPCADSNADCAEILAHENIDGVNAANIWNATLLFSEVDDFKIDHMIFKGNKTARFQKGARDRGLSLSLFGQRNAITNSISKNSAVSSGLQFPGFGGRKLTGLRMVKNKFVNNGRHDVFRDAAGKPIPDKAQWADGVIVAMAEDSKFIGNTFIDNTDVDLIFWGCIRCEITDNIFFHSNDMGGSSFAALHLGVAVDPAGDPSFQPESGLYTGTTVTRNTVDCGAAKACGYGLLVGVFHAHRAPAVRPVTGAVVENNTVLNAQQGISIHHADGIVFRDNEVKTSGVTDQTHDCADGSVGKKYAWSPFNVSPSFARNINRNGDKFAGIPTTRFDDSCTPNAALGYRSGTRQVSTFEEKLQAVRDLSMKYFGQISANDQAVTNQINYIGGGGSLAQLESYFAMIKTAWTTHYGSVPDYKYVDAEMNLLIAGTWNQAKLDAEVKAEAARLKGTSSSSGGGVPSNGRACADLYLMKEYRSNQVPPQGVSREIDRMYSEVLGEIGDYLTGARYLTTLQSQGHGLEGLRRDLINDPTALRAKMNRILQGYLKRDILDADFQNVKAYLATPGNTIRKLEIEVRDSEECRQKAAAPST
ncbi:MAG TPA: hypothetical protein PKC28_06110 [Bdellovibrionales bacterium]|nr:hypothetical protein [Bdellovibrionales bacterium]